MCCCFLEVANISTGYTAYIQDGTIKTGKEFLRLCSRNFEIFADMRDDPLLNPVPTNFKPNPYYKNNLDRLIKERDRFRSMDFREIRQQMIDFHFKNIKASIDVLDRYIAEDEKYLKIKEEVERWVPPTSEYESIKRFALQQIDTSMNTTLREYCGVDLHRKLDVSDKAVRQYIHETDKYYNDAIETAYQRWQENIKATENKNLWMKQFIESLENI